MKTLKQFLFEEKTEQDLIQFLKDNCIQACEDAVTAKRVLWRGIKRYLSGEEYKIGSETNRAEVLVPLKNRRPSDTPEWGHDIFNAYFKKHFGVHIRSECIFCETSKNRAKTYGKTCIVLPIGEYKIIWSPDITDLSTKIFPDKGGPAGNDIYWRKLGYANSNVVPQKEQEEYVKKELDSFHYTDKNIIKAYTHRGELMVLCDKYLAIDYSHGQENLEDIFECIKKVIS